MKKLRSSGSLAGVWLGLVLVLSGCAEAHDVDAILGPPVYAGEGGSGGGGEGGGGEGGSGGGGEGGSGGGGEGGSGGSVDECNNCEPAGMGAQFGIVPCCTEDNKCGLDVGALFGGGASCVEQDVAGTPDDTCPSFSFMGAFELTGCCRADGSCGVNDTFLGLGCTENPDGNGETCGTPSRRGGGRGPQ